MSHRLLKPKLKSSLFWLRLCGDHDEGTVYSPRLTPEDLEKFCETYLQRYEDFFFEHETRLDAGDVIPMEPWWRDFSANAGYCGKEGVDEANDPEIRLERC